VFGYSMGAAFLLLALLKPIFPRHTGLWVGPGVFDLSFRMGFSPGFPPSSVHEVLGWWIIPVCLVMGSLTLAVTTKLVQFLMKRHQWRLPFVNAVQHHTAILAG
jgi:hypothetical protein